jgi:hypothetical protein
MGPPLTAVQCHIPAHGTRLCPSDRRFWGGSGQSACWRGQSACWLRNLCPSDRRFWAHGSGSLPARQAGAPVQRTGGDPWTRCAIRPLSKEPLQEATPSPTTWGRWPGWKPRPEGAGEVAGVETPAGGGRGGGRGGNPGWRGPPLAERRAHLLHPSLQAQRRPHHASPAPLCASPHTPGTAGPRL